MRLFNNAAYYLKYFSFFRGDKSIKEYFSSDDFKEAIKDLASEGYYQVSENFDELVETYSLSTPLNKAEENFVNHINKKLLLNKKSFSEDVILLNIRLTEGYISNYIKSKTNFDIVYWKTILENEVSVLKNIVKKLNPIAEAVILRRFIKKLLEEVILKKYDIIDVENYIPNINVLKSYKLSISKHYFHRKGINKDIQSSLDNLIAEEEEKSSNIKEEEIIPKPKYKFLDSNDTQTPLIFKIMNKAKNQCNQLIHFEDKFQQNLMISEFIINNSEFNEGENNGSEIHENSSKIIEENENKFEKKLIPISKIVEFIANGNNKNKSLEKYKFLRKEAKNRVKSINEKIAEISVYKEDNFISHKEYMNNMDAKIKDELASLVLKDYQLNLSENKIKCFSEYFKDNILNLNDINISEEDGYEGIMNDVNYFNELRRKMTIKEKIKFNISFRINILLINMKKKVENIIHDLDKIKGVEEEIAKLDIYFKNELNKINDQLINSDIVVKLMNREVIFAGVNKKEFISIMKNILQEEHQINIYDPEINNFYFFVYLLKKELYDEKSYKNAVGINEDYI